MNYVLIGRHSERENNPNCEIHFHEDREKIIQNYKNSLRYKQNPYDPYITDFGKESSNQMALNIIDILKKNKDAPKKFAIFTSPFSRCVQTSGQIQNTLFKNGYGLNPIHVEYGLSESIRYPNLLSWNYEKQIFEYKIFTDDFHLEEKGVNDNINLDDEMKTENIQKRFPQYKIDLSYQSIIPFQYSFINNYPNYAIKISKTCDQIIQNNPDTFVIIIAHGHAVIFTYDYFFKKTLGEKDYNYLLYPSGYGSYFIFKKNINGKPELIEFYKGNTEYYNNFPKNRILNYKIIYLFIILFLFLFIFKNFKKIKKCIL